MGPNHCGYFGNYTEPAFEPADRDEEHLHATIFAWLSARLRGSSVEELSFVTLRLLSHDRPYGHGGDWYPLNEGDGCVLSRCCGAKASSVLERRTEWMVGIALRAWNALVLEAP